MKQGTLLIVFLALSASLLSVLVYTAPTVRAESASVHGMVLWIDQYGNAHPMSWAQVTADDGSNRPIIAYTTDGTYMMWLQAGKYNITASSSPGFFPASAAVVVSPGSSASIDFTLVPTGKPIPELPPWAQPLILLCAMMITVLAVRRYRVRPRG